MTPSAAPGIRFGWVTVRLLAFSALPLALAVARIVKTGHVTHGFVFWNLFLAWLPLGFAYLALRSRPAALRLVFGSMWLLFLPNAPYLVTDLIHLRPANDIPILYDVVLLFSAALSGVALGAVSLHWMQAGVARALGRWPSHAFVLTTLVAAGFGVYLGRFLRWNSWDAILRPGAVAQDILDPLLHPVAHWQTWALTLLFAAVLACAYWLPSLFTGLKPEEN